MLSVVVFGTRRTVKLKPLLRTVPLMWPTAKWCPVISINFSKVVFVSKTHTQPQQTHATYTRSYLDELRGTFSFHQRHCILLICEYMPTINNTRAKLCEAGCSQQDAGTETWAAAQLTKHTPWIHRGAGTVALPAMAKVNFIKSWVTGERAERRGSKGSKMDQVKQRKRKEEWKTDSPRENEFGKLSSPLISAQ